MPKQRFHITPSERPSTSALREARDLNMADPPLAGTATDVGGGITGDYGNPADIAEADAPYTKTWTGLAQPAPPPSSRRSTSSGAP